MRGLKRELPSRLANRWLLEEISPYLDKLAAYGSAGAACLRMLSHPSAAARGKAERLQQKAAANPHQMCGTLMDSFIARALREYDSAHGDH
jgi:hypothetical protein